jgi:hypothetical protein
MIDDSFSLGAFRGHFYCFSALAGAPKVPALNQSTSTSAGVGA